MADVSSVSNTNSTVATSPTTTTNVGEQFDTFIKLLTAQVQNQDPLEPLDSTQFVEQLATFSALEQQVRSNTSLESIAAMMSDLHTIVASQWLGQNVSVESSWVPFTSDAVNFVVDTPADVDRAVLSVRDNSGNVVWTQTLDTSAESYSWDGHMQSGDEAAPEGLYQFGIDLYSSGTYLGTVAPRILTTVTDIGNEDGSVVFGTSASLTTDANNIRKTEQ